MNSCPGFIRLHYITITSTFMKISTGLLCLFLIGGAIPDLSAQTGKLLTLDAAVKLALEYNVQVIQAQNRLEGSQSSTRAAYGALLPSLSASGSFSRQQQWQAGGVPLIGGGA